MVFGLSSSESRQRGTHQRSSAIGGQFSTNLEARKPGEKKMPKQNFLASWFPDSEWGPHCYEENRNHRHRYDQFADHCAQISQQTSPSGATGVDHSFARDEFAGDGTDHRPDKQADDSEEETNERANACTERAPFSCSKIFCAKIAAEEIEYVGKKREQHENNDRFPADTLLRAYHEAMDDCGGQNDCRAGEDRCDCANQTNCEEHKCEQPP